MIVDRRSARVAWPRAGHCHREDIEVRTPAGLAFVDVTPRLVEVVERSGIAEGLVSVQSLHTTAAVIVNENEPLLLQDLRAALERAAPRHLAYRHDDFGPARRRPAGRAGQRPRPLPGPVPSRLGDPGRRRRPAAARAAGRACSSSSSTARGRGQWPSPCSGPDGGRLRPAASHRMRPWPTRAWPSSGRASSGWRWPRAWPRAPRSWSSSAAPATGRRRRAATAR